MGGLLLEISYLMIFEHLNVLLVLEYQSNYLSKLSIISLVLFFSFLFSSTENTQVGH